MPIEEEANGHLADKVQNLSDIELAVLICLIAEQHCIIETDAEGLNGLEQELRIIASDIFGLTCSVLDCTENTSIDEFGNGVLVKEDADDYFGGRVNETKSTFFSHSDTTQGEKRGSRSPRAFSPLDSRRIANIVIAKNLNQASSQVQVQALELIRGKRIFTRTAVHATPKPFLFISLNVSGTARLTTHLSDHFFISHKHQADDGLPNLEDLEAKEIISEDDASTSSVVKSSPYMFEPRKVSALTFHHDEIAEFSRLTSEVKISSEVRAYLHNIVVFMRLHRAVAGGISAMATRHFDTLAHITANDQSTLAPLHGLSYATPSMVALAARKIYPHRIVITPPERERSMQWGSSLEAVKAVLDGVTVEDVIEEVLQSVEVPL